MSVKECKGSRLYDGPLMLKCQRMKVNWPAAACILILPHIGTGDNVFTKVSPVCSCDTCCSCVATTVLFYYFVFDRFFGVPLRAMVAIYAAPVISRGPNTIAGVRTAISFLKK